VAGLLDCDSPDHKVHGVAEKQEILKTIIQTLYLQNYKNIFILFIVTNCYGAEFKTQVAACPPPQRFQKKTVLTTARFCAANYKLSRLKDMDI
jgi:hypothetical protein